MGKVVALEALKTIRTSLHQEKKKVVFANGVFDIIHRGHIEYLTQAKTLGDVLIVGLNSDASVRRIKGEKRPIVEQDDRAFVLANILPVDYVCLFDEDTPKNLIAALVPDVLVKGADWNLNDIVGKEIVESAGGIVTTINYIPDRSTSSIVDRILTRFTKR
ncbi:MAG: D-glycero-beta-D-manno-heptose 1-phosphate adenylyltransferase [Bacteroidota bacterium]|nr:D-glycero-beta-D-manno-heptose 1-phosphate adenylyltransferase [Bacteroidota bacterium]